MVTVSPPRKSVDVELLRKINMGFSDGEYDEFDACDWLLDNAEAVLNTCQALADFVAAAEKAKGDLAAVGRSILDGEPYLYQYQLMVAIQDDLNDEALRARKVMKEEA